MSNVVTHPLPSRTSLWAPQFVLIVSLALTILAGWYIGNSSEVEDQIRFRGLVDSAHDEVAEGMGKYIAVLRGAAGLFAAFGHVTPPQFHSYITESDIQHRYPGLGGVGFAPRVSPSQKAAFIATAKSQINPGFTIWANSPTEQSLPQVEEQLPPGDEQPTPANPQSTANPENRITGNDHNSFPICYIEPLDDRNRAAEGFDLASRSTALAALDRARDTGQPIATERLFLLPQADPDSPPGFLVFVPIYNRSTAPATEAERRSSLLGFVFAVFRCDDLFRTLITSEARDRLSVRIYDGSSPLPLFLLHNSPLPSAQSSSYNPRFNASRTIQIAGRTWTIHISERSDFKLESGERLAPFIYLGGLGISLVLYAVTRRQALAQRDLQSAKEAAESANRAKDQFLAVLSHELRTPLTPVLAAAGSSARDRRLPEDIRNDMTMIHRNVELEARLIDDLLDLTRVGRGKLRLQLQTVELHEVICNALTVCSTEEISSKRLRIERHLAAACHHVRGDPARLQQIFWNLLKNAIKFTPHDGQITIRTTNESLTPDAAPSIIIEITDTGIGIEPEVLPKIFDAFEQGSAARAAASGGLGLGLAITRGLVEAHGGAILASSGGPNQGSAFTVRLATIPSPRTKSHMKKDAPAASHMAVTQTDMPIGSVSSLNILLVEDHTDTARVLAKLLGAIGHTVQTASCVSAAIDTAQAATFDLLISDLGLPDGTGFDVLRALRLQPHHSSIPAIALTGYGAEQDHARTTESGFCQHLTKPITFDLLAQTVNQAAIRSPEPIPNPSL